MNLKVLIGIATFQRTKKLQRCLDSIFASSYWNYEIVVVADNNDYATQEYLAGPNMHRLWEVVVQPQQSFVIGNWNRAVKENINELFQEDDLLENSPYTVQFGAFLGLCDDVELCKDTLENAVNALIKQFPDGDGVIGLRQDCPGRLDYTFKPFGQTLMGRKFIERYKDVDYQICCPFYKWAYQDEEMYQYASALKKFYYCDTALLHHYHPGFLPEEMDSTHNITRERITLPAGEGPSLRRPTSLLELDSQLFRRRQAEGKVWGRTWAL